MSLVPLPNEIVLASAGSGKTYRLSNRVIGLIMRGVEPRRIAALTFTKKAAGEFADAILQKLAGAAASENRAVELAEELELSELSRDDFIDVLVLVVTQLPEMFLGTLDSFFARVVRCFQYELGLSGGPFEMIQGEAEQVIVEDLLGEILRGNDLTEDERASFFQSFKMATLGKEEAKVRTLLTEFIKTWHSKRLDVPDQQPWGNSKELFRDQDVSEDWLVQRRAALEGQLEAHLPDHPACLEMLEFLCGYAVGSGDFGKTGLLRSVLKADEKFEGVELELTFNRKVIRFSAPATKALRELITVLAMHEAYNKLTQTAALWAVTDGYERRYEARVRSSGRLTFSDLKLKMSAWARTEMDRVRREQVDFRLDARYDHWLLDEFQDTSRPQWLGVQPLIDEVALGGDAELGKRGVFVVGDKKQGIYAWRGGDPALFDEIMRRYSGQFETVTLAESWRSQPPLLDFVNRVFGDLQEMADFFPKEAISRWQWDLHTMAEGKESKPAYALVRQMEGRGEEGEEQRIEALLEIIREVNPVERGISCGLLFRGNKTAAKVANQLREAGFPVAENGSYYPGQDSPVGRAVVDLLAWLENPADRFARVHLQMAGLISDHWESEWQRLRERAVQLGWSGMLREAFVEETLSDFGKQRFERLMELIEQALPIGLTTAGELARHLRGNESPSDEMSGALQVMTIHKSKGLGFDMVVIPELSDATLDNAKAFSFCELSDESGVRLLTQTPSQWARNRLPVLAKAENEAMAKQVYEDLCVMYVAMTRAKRALYVLIDAPGSSEPMSHAAWLRRILSEPSDTGALYEAGVHDWFAGEPICEMEKEKPLPSLPPLKTRTARAQASKTVVDLSPDVAAAMKFGSEVHALFEKIEWEPGAIELPKSPAGDAVRHALKSPAIGAIFDRLKGDVTCLREQGFELVLDGVWTTGVCDRLHLYSENGKPVRAEIYDFKTDAVDSEDDLLKEHRSQMSIYQRALQQVLGLSDVRVFLVSVPLGCVIEATVES